MPLRWESLHWVLSDNIIPTTITQITKSHYLKLTALAMTVLGFVLAPKLNLTAQNLKFEYPSNIFKFSNLLGYFSIFMHCLPPLISLSASHKVASLLLDLV